MGRVPVWMAALALVAVPVRSEATPSIGQPCGKKTAENPTGCGSKTEFMCADGVCACAPGFYACGTAACVDIAADAKNCGFCGNSCPSGQSCQLGICGGTPLPEITPWITPAFDTGAGFCTSGFEAHPVYSLNSGIRHEMVLAGTGNPQRTYYYDPLKPKAWALAGKLTPNQTPVPSGKISYFSSGDEWSTSSGFSGYEFLAGRTDDFYDCSLLSGTSCSAGSPCPKTSPKSNLAVSCVGATKTAPGSCKCQFPTGVKQTSMPFVSAAKPADIRAQALPQATPVATFWAFDDGLTLAADPGGSAVWFGVTGGKYALANWDPIAVAYRDCQHPPIGGAQCPPASGGFWQDGGWVDMFEVANSAKPVRQSTNLEDQGHTTAIVNPCTHHALISVSETENGEAFASVRAVDRTGAIVAYWRHDMGPAGGDKQCQSQLTPPFDCVVNALPAKPPTANFLCPPANVSNPKCQTSVTSISRYVPRVQMDVWVDRSGSSATPPRPTRCTLFVGYDAATSSTLAGDPLPLVLRQATLGSIDVTDESTGKLPGPGPITILTQVDASTNITKGHQVEKVRQESMDAVPVASRFANTFALFYVQRDPSAETESFHTRITTDPTFSSFQDVDLEGSMSNHWMGDNMSQMLGGLPGGQLMGTWDARFPDGGCEIRGQLLLPGPCGQPGQPCCGGQCTGQLECLTSTTDPQAGPICQCGGLNQVCCTGSSACETNLTCDVALGYKCITECGHAGQPCCDTYSDAGVATSHGADPIGWCYPQQATCVNNKTCECGGTNQSCCQGNKCGSGLSCSHFLCTTLPSSSGVCPTFNLQACLNRCGTVDSVCQNLCCATAYGCSPTPQEGQIPQCAGTSPASAGSQSNEPFPAETPEQLPDDRD